MRRQRETDAHPTITGLLDALRCGAVVIEHQRIEGYCGWVDDRNRTVFLNPEAPEDQADAQLRHGLELLAPPRPALRLIQGGRS